MNSNVNANNVKLNLPRQTFDPRLVQPAPMPSQEWVTGAVQGTPRAALTVKLPVRKLVAGVAIFMGMLIMLGLGAMLGSQQPDSTTVATLHYAQSHAPAGETCGAVWLDGASRWEVECGSIGR